MLLNISERLNLRGPSIDALHDAEIQRLRQKTLSGVLTEIDSMTLTVFDGDFDRAKLAKMNLYFSAYRMPMSANNERVYHAPTRQARVMQEGTVVVGDGKVVWSENPLLRFWKKVWR